MTEFNLIIPLPKNAIFKIHRLNRKFISHQIYFSFSVFHQNLRLTISITFFTINCKLKNRKWESYKGARERERERERERKAESNIPRRDGRRERRHGRTNCSGTPKRLSRLLFLLAPHSRYPLQPVRFPLPHSPLTKEKDCTALVRINPYAR